MRVLIIGGETHQAPSFLQGDDFTLSSQELPDEFEGTLLRELPVQEAVWLLLDFVIKVKDYDMFVVLSRDDDTRQITASLSNELLRKGSPVLHWPV